MDDKGGRTEEKRASSWRGRGVWLFQVDNREDILDLEENSPPGDVLYSFAAEGLLSRCDGWWPSAEGERDSNEPTTASVKRDTDNRDRVQYSISVSEVVLKEESVYGRSSETDVLNNIKNFTAELLCE